MGFQAAGMSSSFTRQGATGGQSDKKPFRICKAVTIDSYELGQRQIHCTDRQGNKMIVQIRPATIERNVTRSNENAATRTEPPKWEGYLIDSRMESSLPPGNLIVLESVEKMRSIQHNGQTVGIYMSDRVMNPADQSPDKTREGLYSISTYQDHVFHVLEWEEKAVAIDDEAQIERIREALEEGEQAYLRKELRPYMGVQFRVVLPAPAEGERCPVIDTSPFFDWVSRQFDENQQEISQGHPMGGQKFMDLLFDPIEGFAAYAKNNFPEDRFAGAFVEICPYISYRAGPRSRYMAISEKTFDPIHQMANVQTRLAIDDEKFMKGRALAVMGVLQLSADQVDLTNRSFKARNIAVRLHASGPKGHVHAWVRTSTGLKTQPHEALRPIRTQQPDANKPASQSYPSHAPQEQAPGRADQPPRRAEQQSYSAPVRAPAPAPAPAPAAGPMDNNNAFDDWDEIPFGDPDETAAKARQQLAEARKLMD